MIESPLFLNSEEFSEQLLREGARADRTNSSFLLLTFDLRYTSKGDENHREVYEALAYAVLTRARASDVVGEYEEGIGLVLYQAPLEAAKKYIDEVETSFRHAVSQRFSNLGSQFEIVNTVVEYSEHLNKQVGIS